MIDNQERLINNLVIEMIIFPKCSSLCANHLHDCHSYLANYGLYATFGQKSYNDAVQSKQLEVKVMSDFVKFAEKVINFLRSILVNGEPNN